MTRTLPSAPTITFCGLKSRWTSPARAPRRGRAPPRGTRPGSRAGARALGQPRGQRLAVDELHRDEHAIVEACRRRGRPPRSGATASRSPSPRAAVGSRPRAAVAVALRVQQLERDLAIQLGVVGGEHLAHAAAPDSASTTVAADRGAPRRRRQRSAPAPAGSRGGVAPRTAAERPAVRSSRQFAQIRVCASSAAHGSGGSRPSAKARMVSSSRHSVTMRQAHRRRHHAGRRRRMVYGSGREDRGTARRCFLAAARARRGVAAREPLETAPSRALEETLAALLARGTRGPPGAVASTAASSRRTSGAAARRSTARPPPCHAEDLFLACAALLGDGPRWRSCARSIGRCWPDTCATSTCRPRSSTRSSSACGTRRWSAPPARRPSSRAIRAGARWPGGSGSPRSGSR